MRYLPNTNAQRLARGGDEKLVVLVTLYLDLGVTTRKIQLMQRALHDVGYTAQIHASGALTDSTADDQVQLLRSVRQSAPRAIVCFNTWLDDEAAEELARYQAEGGLVVCLDRQSEGPHDLVVFDREDNSYQAARHLLELGHRCLGFWMSGRPRGLRLRGFERALNEWNVDPRTAWVIGGGSSAQPERSGAEIARQFLELPLLERPSAMCIVNDASAQACIAELMRAKVRVPADLSVVGHDNLDIAQFGAVPLTTVSQPVEALAQNAFAMLNDRLANRYDGPPRRETLRGQLIVRQSTAPFHRMPL